MDVLCIINSIRNGIGSRCILRLKRHAEVFNSKHVNPPLTIDLESSAQGDCSQSPFCNLSVYQIILQVTDRIYLTCGNHGSIELAFLTMTNIRHFLVASNSR